LSYNAVHGTIPGEIGNMTDLFGLYLEGNYLVSSIPTEFGSMKSLGELYLPSNYISGTIPSQVCGMESLIKFFGYNNSLSGSIPSCIGEMTNLRMISLYSNLMSGSLPSQIGKLSNLLELSGKINYFTGQIPKELYNLSQLKQFWLAHNYISGTLPPLVSSLSSVYQFELGLNLMSGAIPDEIFYLSELQSLFLDENQFSSTIPSAIFVCTQVEYLYLDYNRLIGTIADLFSNASRLQYFSVASNYLSGSIPSSLYELHSMQELSVGGNSFTGGIAPTLANLTDLELVNFGSCLLTGSLPHGLSRLLKLKSFTTQFNYLSGSVDLPFSPNSMKLQDLEIGSNYLTGLLPIGLANMGRLEELKASHNLFTGKIDFLFNRSVASGLGQLEFIDLSNNALSGTIPPSMFVGARFRPLSAVVLYQNCFTGSLPSSICQAGNLTSLILDSVSSAPACDVRFTGFWKDLFKVVIGKRSLHGTIPECIWSMRSLQTLHLAGNGLGGTLPSDKLQSEVATTAAATVYGFGANDLPTYDIVEVNQTIYRLNDVNLASNALTGSIPFSWQEWPWKSLDLSGNKLSGILSAGFVVNNTCSASEQISKTNDDYYAYYDDQGYSPSAAYGVNNSQLCGVIDLTVNRLSGRIPGAFRYAQGVNILDGNLFACQSDDMPQSDPMTAEYVCGSSDFNNSLILWMCLFSFCICILLCFTRRMLFSTVRELIGNLIGGHDAGLLCPGLDILPYSQYRRPIILFLSFLQRIAALSLVLGSFYLFVCMVSYIGMKASNWHYQERGTISGFVETFALSTHTYQYAWLSTAGYLHGSVPVGVVVVYLFVSLIIIVWFLSSSWQTTKLETEPSASATYRTASTAIKLPQELGQGNTEALREELVVTSVDCSSSKTTEGVYVSSLPPVSGLNEVPLSTVAVPHYATAWSVTIRLFVLIIVHAVVMISVNILYIYIILTGLSSNFLLFLVQLGLSVFKLLWNRHYISFVVDLSSTSATVAVQCCSFMVLFTFIISPVLATFFSDSTCFRYFITGQSAVSTSFQMDVYECYLVCSIECASFCYFSGDAITVVASVVPSWQYSYQCSSSLLVNYTPVLLYSFAITSLLVPLLEYLYCQLPYAAIENIVPGWLIVRFITGTIYAHNDKRSWGHVTAGAQEHVLASRQRKLFNGLSIVSRAYTNIGVLITFGLASPLLALAVSMDCINLYFVWKALFQRYLSLFVFAESSLQGGHGVKQADNCVYCPDAVERLAKLARSADVMAVEGSEKSEGAAVLQAEVIGTGGAGNVLWMVVWIAGLFWGLFVFDMYGDIYGAVDGLCIILLPTVGGIIIFSLASRCCGYYDRRATTTGFGRATEIGSVQSPVFDPQDDTNEFYNSRL
jgi:Leucine-rich repeat (LRR) protein